MPEDSAIGKEPAPKPNVIKTEESNGLFPVPKELLQILTNVLSQPIDWESIPRARELFRIIQSDTEIGAEEFTGHLVEAWVRDALKRAVQSGELGDQINLSHVRYSDSKGGFRCVKGKGRSLVFVRDGETPASPQAELDSLLEIGQERMPAVIEVKTGPSIIPGKRTEKFEEYLSGRLFSALARVKSVLSGFYPNKPLAYILVAPLDAIYGDFDILEQFSQREGIAFIPLSVTNATIQQEGNRLARKFAEEAGRTPGLTGRRSSSSGAT